MWYQKILLLVLSTTTVAVDNLWLGPSGVWSNAALWSLGHVPTGSEVAKFPSSSSVVLDSAIVVANLTVQTGSNVTISGNGNANMTVTYSMILETSSMLMLNVSSLMMTAATCSISGMLTMSPNTAAQFSDATVTINAGGNWTVQGSSVFLRGGIIGYVVNNGNFSLYNSSLEYVSIANHATLFIDSSHPTTDTLNNYGVAVLSGANYISNLIVQSDSILNIQQQCLVFNLLMMPRASIIGSAQLAFDLHTSLPANPVMSGSITTAVSIPIFFQVSVYVNVTDNLTLFGNVLSSRPILQFAISPNTTMSLMPPLSYVSVEAFVGEGILDINTNMDMDIGVSFSCRVVNVKSTVRISTLAFLLGESTTFNILPGATVTILAQLFQGNLAQNGMIINNGSMIIGSTTTFTFYSYRLGAGALLYVTPFSWILLVLQSNANRFYGNVIVDGNLNIPTMNMESGSRLGGAGSLGGIYSLLNGSTLAPGWYPNSITPTLNGTLVISTLQSEPLSSLEITLGGITENVDFIPVRVTRRINCMPALIRLNFTQNGVATAQVGQQYRLVISNKVSSLAGCVFPTIQSSWPVDSRMLQLSVDTDGTLILVIVGCPPGMFTSSFTNVNDNRNYLNCTLCPAGTYTTGGQIPCTKCPAGKYSDSPGASSCSTCPVGLVAFTVGMSRCLPCTTGHYSASSAVCAICLEGSYSNSTGQTGCYGCDAGTFQQYPASSSCDLCSKGSISQNSSQSSCESCVAGSYQPNDGGTTCLSCPLGSYSSSDNAFECLQCPVGWISNGAACNICLPGTYATNNECATCPFTTSAPTYGATACIECPTGWFMPNVTSPSCEQCGYPGTAPCPTTVITTSTAKMHTTTTATTTQTQTTTSLVLQQTTINTTNITAVGAVATQGFNHLWIILAAIFLILLLLLCLLIFLVQRRQDKKQEEKDREYFEEQSLDEFEEIVGAIKGMLALVAEQEKDLIELRCILGKIKRNATQESLPKPRPPPTLIAPPPLIVISPTIDKIKARVPAALIVEQQMDDSIPVGIVDDTVIVSEEVGGIQVHCVENEDPTLISKGENCFQVEKCASLGISIEIEVQEAPLAVECAVPGLQVERVEEEGEPLLIHTLFDEESVQIFQGESAAGVVQVSDSGISAFTAETMNNETGLIAIEAEIQHLEEARTQTLNKISELRAMLPERRPIPTNTTTNYSGKSRWVVKLNKYLLRGSEPRYAMEERDAATGAQAPSRTARKFF